MKFAPLAVAALAAAFAAPAHAALTVETTNFIGGHTNYNGIEGWIGVNDVYPGPYTEQSITIEHVGTLLYFDNNIQAIAGLSNWYALGYGYSRITFGGTINAVEFLAGTGWAQLASEMQYQVLNAGTVIGTGSVCCVPNFPTGARYFGFSGANFDEIRLQAQASGATGFDASQLDAINIDAINFNGYANAVPEPASWALMIAGFGMIGAAQRSVLRRRKAAFAA